MQPTINEAEDYLSGLWELRKLALLSLELFPEQAQEIVIPAFSIQGKPYNQFRVLSMRFWKLVNELLFPVMLDHLPEVDYAADLILIEIVESWNSELSPRRPFAYEFLEHLFLSLRSGAVEDYLKQNPQLEGHKFKAICPESLQQLCTTEGGVFLQLPLVIAAALGCTGNPFIDFALYDTYPEIDAWVGNFQLLTADFQEALLLQTEATQGALEIGSDVRFWSRAIELLRQCEVPDES